MDKMLLGLALVASMIVGCGGDKPATAPHEYPSAAIVDQRGDLPAPDQAAGGAGGAVVPDGGPGNGGADDLAVVSMGGAAGSAGAGGAPGFAGAGGGGSQGNDAGAGGSAPGITLARDLTIMVGGDSITCGSDGDGLPAMGGYRTPMFAALGPHAIPVGPRSSAAICGGPGSHAGYPGIHTTGFAALLFSTPDRVGWLEAYDPDILALMLGTNGDGAGPEYVRDLIRPALDSWDGILVVAAIPDSPALGTYPATFDISLAAALAAVPEYGTRLFWIPETEFVPASGFGADGLHPNAAGYQALAQTYVSGLTRTRALGAVAR